jgi:hypothetical protein
MGTPGSGRYTTYLPVNSPRTERLMKLFKGGGGEIYGGAKSNADAAAAIVKVAKSLFNGKGDVDIFGNGVSLEYVEAPNTVDVQWAKPGDPANPYVPDITSPGPGRTEGVEKDSNPQLAPNDIKPNFDKGNPTVNTTSPAGTSKRLGTTSLGENLSGGKSSVE